MARNGQSVTYEDADLPVTRRPATTEDEPFLRRLITATVAEELQAHLWPQAQRESLLQLQYTVRRQGVRANYPNAVQEIILLDDAPAGYMVVARSTDEILLVDIAVLGEHRGSGVGTAVLRELCAESDGTGKSVNLSVNVTNRAIRLYERLGFERTGGDEVQHLMRRRPAGQRT